MGVSKNNGTPKSSILMGFSIVNHPFGGTPIFGNTHITFFSRKMSAKRLVIQQWQAIMLRDRPQDCQVVVILVDSEGESLDIYERVQLELNVSTPVDG